MDQPQPIIQEPIPGPGNLNTTGWILLSFTMAFLVAGLILGWIGIGRDGDRRIYIATASLLTISLLFFISLTVVISQRKPAFG